MNPNTDTPDQEIIQGDCIDEMQAMDENSVHAVVCDPPYGLAFMPGVNEWDEFDSPKDYQDFCEEWAAECRRVLKPGGHLIAFSGDRTYGRLMCGVQDAGFEIRDTLTYHYGTGFPKGSDVGKHIDRFYDAEREVVGQKRTGNAKQNTNESGEIGNWSGDNTSGKQIVDVTAPATSEAEQWDGWRTQLKPTTEFAVLARAPMSESAVYRNVLEHGCGALNIDRTLIPTESRPQRTKQTETDDTEGTQTYGDGISPECKATGTTTEGRYPANLLLDGVASRMLDEQSGECGDLVGADKINSPSDSTDTAYGEYAERSNIAYNDSGGASRFFYTSKSSKAERTINGQIDNEHPTVKPLGLMEWLVTLVTAPGQRVLDPFAGSGTTIMACRRLGREGIGIEKDDEHAALARKRVELAHELETGFTESGSFPETHREAPSFNEWLENRDEDDEDDGPTTLESFADADDD